MDLRYPIGKYETQPFSSNQKRLWLQDIQFLPGLLETAIENLDEAQLNTPYRDGGWTVKQVVHHVADSHMNAYVRFKLGLTEDNPTIKPYDEARWAELKDVQAVPINMSITLLYTLHTRWHAAILHLTDQEWQRTVFHPEHKKEMSLWLLLGMYAWHGKHHVAHITSLRERKRWD
ncbi:YfiT family bacillithiol transferase [Pseudobacter ginsenosidimutans]|uniref:DinB family protein n=1 Tax=Pseudobacter ginsenosidimutans TaxID=661488 RepID=A0A4Q7N5U8_9BACT|nr:bacillithiol transferase BstA [Pseudobacter ginsenosidimutans]QEC44943.1 putative metal-dependent hydrolase [Pseudobacter ginsenosidimutans]RZS76434.1 DinB family protein [Pseudobacter ginsenosidimutans]